MFFSLKTRNTLFKIFAALAGIVAIYHLVGLFYKVDESPVMRHFLFVIINIFCIYGFLKRPKYFIGFVSLLFIQQFYSHGTYMLNLWLQTKQIHWISVLVLLILPISLFCLIEDYYWQRNSIKPVN